MNEPRMPGEGGDDGCLAEKLAFLHRAASFGPDVETVHAVETHMSWVFLADGYAYKLKKPVRFPFLDFSTLEARRRDCEEELRLNRRLAAEVYLGTVPLTRAPDGGLALGGRGAVVDWLVKMRRLPDEGMLDRLLLRGAVPAPRVRALVERLVRFYRAAPAVDWRAGVYAQRMLRDAEEDASELLLPAYGLPGEQIRAVLAAQRAFLARNPERLDRRVQAGRVVEGHGDLRPEHVCLDPGPLVIDCLEFNREFRLLDAVDELAYLALECERLGDAAIGAAILTHYVAISGDAPDAALVSLYKSRRACLRAKIAVWHLREADVADPQKWLNRARHYLALAARYAHGLASESA